MMLRGRRIIIRRKKLSDAWDDYKWRKDPELCRLDAAVPTCISFPEFYENYLMEMQREHPWQRQFAIDTVEGKHIGNVMYYNLDPERREVEIGIMIGDKNYWGKEYGKEAVLLFVDFLFKELGVERIKLRTLTWNKRAQRCFEKCGFVPKGKVLQGEHEFVIMELTRGDHERRKELSI